MPTNNFEDDEFGFKPAEEVNLDRTLSPAGGRTTDILSKLISTPREMKSNRNFEDSPNPLKFTSEESLLKRVKYLEDELRELNDFKKIESTVGEDHNKLSMKLSHANDQIAILEVKIEELEEKLKQNAIDAQVQTAKNEKEKALKEKTAADNILASVEYEYEQFKVKSKKRETELIQSLDEARDESKTEVMAEKIKSLEEQLMKAETVVLSLQSSPKPVDIMAGGDSIVVNNIKIAELETKLREANEAREKLQVALKDKRDEATRINSEYDEVSTQLMDQIQENELLQKKCEETESMIVKIGMINEVLNSIHNDEELPEDLNFGEDESVQALLQIRNGIIELRQNESFIVEIQTELEKVRSENEFLKTKLPTIQESTTESENELKDKIDALTIELMEMKSNLEGETGKAAESKHRAESSNQELLDELEILKGSKAEKEIELILQIEQLAVALHDKDEKVKELEDAMAAQEAEMATEIAGLKNGLNKIMSLGEENARLKIVENDYKRVVNDFNNKIDDMRQKTEDLKEARDAADANAHRVREMEQNAMNMKKNLEELSMEVARKSDDIARLETDIEMLEEKNDKLLESVEDGERAKEQSLDLELRVHELQEQLSAAQKPTSTNTTAEFESIAQTAIMEEADELNGQLKEALEKIAALEAELEQAKLNVGSELENAEKIAAFGLEIAGLRQENEKIAVLEGALEKAKAEKNLEQIASLEVKIAELELKISNLQQQENAKVAALQTELEVATAQKSEKITALEQEIANLRQENENISALKNELKIAEAKDENNEKIAELEREVFALREDNEKIGHLELINDELRLNHSKALEHSADLEKKLSEFQEIAAQVSSAEQQRETLEDELKKSKANAEFSADQLEAFKTKCDELQQQIATKEQSIKILETHIDDKNHEIIELQKSVEDSESLKSEAEKAKQSLQSLKTVVDSMTSEKLMQDKELQALSNKVKELTTEARDANERSKNLQTSLSKLDAENTNLKSKLHIVGEETDLLKKQLKERSDECDEIKTRFRRRSCDNDKKLQTLENEKDLLVQQIGAVEAMKAAVECELQRVKAEHLHLVEHQVPKLHDENERLKSESADNDLKFAILDEKYSQLCETYQKVEDELRKQPKQQFNAVMKTNERLEKEIFALNDKITQQVSENFVHNKTIANLRDERDSLMLEVDALKKKKSMSPEKKKGDLFASQNQQLLMEGFKSTPTRAVERNYERKNRRQSVHDEHRRLSVWEQFSNAEVQTEAVSEICACSELTQKVKELQIEVRKRDCKLSTMERMAQHNPLKLDLDDAKKALTREQREHQQTKFTLDSLSRNVVKLEAKIEALSKNQIVEKEKSAKAMQTDGEVFIEKVRRLHNIETNFANIFPSISRVNTTSSKRNSTN